jgi:hypothetical protein
MVNRLQKFAQKLIGINPNNRLFNTNTSYAVTNGNIISSEDNRTTYITRGYQANDIIFSIVNLIVEKVRVAPWAVYKIEDEQALKMYRGIMARKELTGDDFIRAMNFRKKALVEYTGDARLNELLKYPNDYCTFSDLVGDSSIFKLVAGGRMIWADQLGAGANGSFPQSLHHLPYDLVTIIASRPTTTEGGDYVPVSELGYRIDSFGQFNIPKSAVMHDKYFNPRYDTMGSQLFGQSPLKAGLSLLDLSNSSNRTATAQFQNQGPKQIIFMDDPQFRPEEGNLQAQAIKNILQGKEYGGPDNAGKTATSGYKMGVIAAGISPVDLGIVQLQEWQLRRFCNLFGCVPSQVLNDPENKSYNNAIEGERALTNRGALPLLTTFRDYFNMTLYNQWGYKGKNIYVDADLTVYSELQDNLKDKWTWVKELPVSWKKKLELMGLEYDESDPGIDEVMIPSGFTPIDSMNAVDNVLSGLGVNSNGQVHRNGQANGQNGQRNGQIN